MACRPGDHELDVILRSGPASEEHVARWCKLCGAVVVDLDFDNRTKPGAVMKMRVPARPRP
jgi:hypothetical protein